MYKIELHAHTKPVSGCGQLRPEELMKAYSDVGYKGIVIANHFTKDLFAKDPEGRLEYYMNAYRECEEAGEKYGIKVYWGAEFRFSAQIQDFLVYGVTESLLRKMVNAFDYSFEQFHELVKSEGGLFIQAHPFRHIDLIIPISDLDGIEMYNMHSGHDSRNACAQLVKEKFGIKIATSGSDCHEYCHVGRGGIEVDELPEDNKALCEVLRNGNFNYITNYDFNYCETFMKG